MGQVMTADFETPRHWLVMLDSEDGEYELGRFGSKQGAQCALDAMAYRYGEGQEIFIRCVPAIHGYFD